MSAAQKYVPHYTVADYQTWEGDWELWAGVPVSMSPSAFGLHQTVLTRLAYQRTSEIERVCCKAEVIVELDWIISHDTVVRPDLVVVCGPPPQKHLEATPTMAAEILSDSSSRRDSIHKRDLYDEQGVDVYLVIDPAHCIVTIDKSKLFR